jgi:hypothetical protein
MLKDPVYAKFDEFGLSDLLKGAVRNGAKVSLPPAAGDPSRQGTTLALAATATHDSDLEDRRRASEKRMQELTAPDQTAGLVERVPRLYVAESAHARCRMPNANTASPLLPPPSSCVNVNVVNVVTTGTEQKLPEPSASRPRKEGPRDNWLGGLRPGAYVCMLECVW